MKKKLLLLSFIILLVVFPFLSFKLYIFYQRNYIPNINIDFLTENVKNDILSIEKNINKKWGSYIYIEDKEIIYYKIRPEIDFVDKNPPEYITRFFADTSISSITLLYTDYKLDKIRLFSKNNSKYYYIYTPENHWYKEGEILPGLEWRIEKVIDNNWYILRKCDRIICPESLLNN
jgi:hypothetical protein